MEDRAYIFNLYALLIEKISSKISAKLTDFDKFEEKKEGSLKPELAVVRILMNKHVNEGLIDNLKTLI